MAETQALSDLPEQIPIFPLAGVLLLPGGRLPLNIFEPRYLEMTSEAMRGDRMIGMLQPENPNDTAYEPVVYQTGCAGRITSFEETDDGRYVIILSGVIRFRIVRELIERNSQYRQVIVDWRPFAHDIESPDESVVDRERLLPSLLAYLKLAGIEVDRQAIENAPSTVLVDQLAMICPFQPSEKQAILESEDLLERGQVMTALIEMALLGRQGGESPDTSH